MPARIVVVEDNVANLELMNYLLRAFGHVIFSASEGEQALELAERERPDLVICDVQLPTISGVEVARRLKSHPRLRTIPLLAVTAYAMVGDREKLLEAGFDAYLAKPINPELFQACVDELLPEGKRAHFNPPPREPVAVPQPQREDVPARAAILAVDDVAANLQFLESLLGPHGYTVLLARKVSHAMRLLHTHKVDLILSDVHLGRESGPDLLRAVKADPKLNEIPFIFLSATDRNISRRRQLLQEGAAGLVARPVDPEALLAEIESHLKRC